MRAQVESSRCQGHTLCAMIAPESFVLDDVDGHASAAGEEVAREHEHRVHEAARSCPEQAIIVVTEGDAAAQHAQPRRNGCAL